MTQSIVRRPFGWVSEHVVGLVEHFELRVRSRVVVPVGVVLLDLATIGVGDLPVARIGSHVEYFVEIEGHRERLCR